MLIKNISLIGFMGSGKTTVGKLLANELGFLFIDIDKIIEYTTGLEIKDIFEKYGEEYFRDIEEKTIKKIYAQNKKCVFACGGGAFIRAENIKIIKKNSFVINLKISADEAYKRLKHSNDRPLLFNKDDSSENLRQKIYELIKQREKSYSENCNYEVLVDNKSPENVKEEILLYLKDEITEKDII